MPDKRIGQAGLERKVIAERFNDPGNPIKGGPVENNRTEIEGGDIENIFKEGRDFNIGAVMELVPAALNANKDDEDNNFNEGTDSNSESTAPEVEFIEHAGAEAEDAGMRDDKTDDAESDGRFVARPAIFIFEEGNNGLHKRNGRSNASQEKEKEPVKAEDFTKADTVHNNGHSNKPEIKHTAGYFAGLLGAEEHVCGGDDNTTADNDFEHFVHTGGGSRREGDVIIAAQVGGVGHNSAQADAQSKEDLTCGRHPDFGILEGAEIGIPHKTESIINIQVDQVRIGSTIGKDPDHEKDTANDEDGDSKFAQEFNSAGEPFINNNEIDGEGDEKEAIGDADTTKVLVFDQALESGKEAAHL